MILDEHDIELLQVQDGGVTHLDTDGRLHCEDGPAYVSPNGGRVVEYWLHGKLHREDGPARVWKSSINPDEVLTESYWLFGRPIAKERFTPEFVLMTVIANTGL